MTMTIKSITFLDQLYPFGIFSISDPSIDIFDSTESFEIAKILNSLDNNKVYVLSFELVISWSLYDEDNPTITLSKPILITKNSNSKIISEFLLERISLAVDSYYLDDDLFKSFDNLEGPGIIVKYKEIKLF